MTRTELKSSLEASIDMQKARVGEDEYGFYWWRSDDGLEGGPFIYEAEAQHDARELGYEPVDALAAEDEERAIWSAGSQFGMGA